MPNFNNQDPRATGADNAGVYGFELGGEGLQSGAQRAADGARSDEMIDQDVENLTESLDQARTEDENTRRNTPGK